MTEQRKPIYVLYIKRGHMPCEQAMRLIPRNVRIAVQDIDHLQKKPAWLDGVPLLCRVKDRMIYRGEKVLDMLQTYIDMLEQHVWFDWTPRDLGPSENDVAPYDEPSNPYGGQPPRQPQGQSILDNAVYSSPPLSIQPQVLQAQAQAQHQQPQQPGPNVNAQTQNAMDYALKRREARRSANMVQAMPPPDPSMI